MMSKQTKPFRLLDLMERVEWEGHTNWKIVEEKARNQYVIPFKVWLKQNINYLPTLKVRQAIILYYLEGGSEDGSRFYQYKDMGTEALAALYAKEKDIQ